MTSFLNIIFNLLIYIATQIYQYFIQYFTLCQYLLVIELIVLLNIGFFYIKHYIFYIIVIESLIINYYIFLLILNIY